MTAQTETPTLKRTVGVTQLTLYGLGSMLGAGIYGLIGQAAGIMGSAVWLAFIAAMVAALLTGLTYASIGSRYPRAAGDLVRGLNQITVAAGEAAMAATTVHNSLPANPA